VDVVLTVAASGRVEGVASDLAFPHELDLELRRVRFDPATVHGAPVTTTIAVSVQFGPSDGGAPTWRRSGTGWAITF
jgi:hypothetical protein